MKHLTNKNIILILLGILLGHVLYMVATLHHSYLIHYNTYRYYWEENTYIPGCQNCTLTIEGFSEDNAVENMRDFLFMNTMLVGDSLEVLNVEKL